MLDWVRPLVGEQGVTVVYECRRCGTTLDPHAQRCPYCGPTDVVRFEIE